MKVEKVMPEISAEVKFGDKGVFPVKGDLYKVGIFPDGKPWFSLLITKVVYEKTGLGKVKTFIKVEKQFKLEQVQDQPTKDIINMYLEGLKE